VRVTVVGAGIVGLTTALVLEEHGHDVRVVAREQLDATTSAVAAAVWFPYRAGPPDRVVAWAAITRAWLESLVAERAAGIDLLTCYEITADDAVPWWAAGLDVTRTAAPVTGRPLAWRFVAPRVEPARFLPWLTSRLRAPIEARTVADLAAEPGDVVVNCAGLGARTLAHDDHLSPLFGQVVLAECGDVDRSISITDDRDPDAMFYLIPRRDELVLGGCSLPWTTAPPQTDPAITARIVDHARALDLPIGRVTASRVGLRPLRPTVRLERDGRIVHNYGHGGAGFTLCRGCAEDVASLTTGTV
jgi:D-amino-acid oxidase